MIKYLIILALLIIAELVYFKIADKCNIIDKPNQRSSHTKIVIRGGGIVFLVGVWIWSAFYDFQYPWFLAAVTLAAGISFIDDIKSLPDYVRLGGQFAAMAMMLFQLDIMYWNMWWIIVIALIICVGATNIYNFMDGINGMTAGYSMGILIPLFLLNRTVTFVDQTLIEVTVLATLVFSFFNFRKKNKAKCFAGDVGSVGIALILIFMIGRLILKTGDVTWLTFLVVYGVDGCLTLFHRILLHEHLGQAHRKHMYQILSNELGMSHVIVSSIYMFTQLAISLVIIYLIPDTSFAHWIFLVAMVMLLALIYLLFMKKYYHLHEEYLTSFDQ